MRVLIGTATNFRLVKARSLMIPIDTPAILQNKKWL